MTGKQCDACTHTYSVPVEQHNVVHCEGQHSHTVPLCKSGETHFFYHLCVCFSVCDSCVVVLLEDLDRLEGNFHSVSDQLSSLNASAMAWTQLYGLNKSLEDAAVSTHTCAHSIVLLPRLLRSMTPLIPADHRELQQHTGRQQK